MGVRNRTGDGMVGLLESIQAAHLSRSPAKAEGSTAVINPFCRGRFLCLLSFLDSHSSVQYFVCIIFDLGLNWLAYFLFFLLISST